MGTTGRYYNIRDKIQMKEKTKIFIKNSIGSSFGLGFAPILPGSFGTLPGVLLHYLFTLYTTDLIMQLIFLIVYFLIISIIHYKLTAWAVVYYNDNDPSQFVLDEIVGYLYTQIQFIILLLIFNPAFFHTANYSTNKMIIWGFILFRILDMIKIPPAWQVDKKMHNATGIILDDIISGAYASLVLYGLFYYVFI